MADNEGGKLEEVVAGDGGVGGGEKDGAAGSGLRPPAEEDMGGQAPSLEDHASSDGRDAPGGEAQEEAQQGSQEEGGADGGGQGVADGGGAGGGNAGDAERQVAEGGVQESVGGEGQGIAAGDGQGGIALKQSGEGGNDVNAWEQPQDDREGEEGAGAAAGGARVGAEEEALVEKEVPAARSGSTGGANAAGEQDAHGGKDTGAAAAAPSTGTCTPSGGGGGRGRPGRLKVPSKVTGSRQVASPVSFPGSRVRNVRSRPGTPGTPASEPGHLASPSGASIYSMSGASYTPSFTAFLERQETVERRKAEALERIAAMSDDERMVDRGLRPPPKPGAAAKQKSMEQARGEFEEFIQRQRAVAEKKKKIATMGPQRVTNDVIPTPKVMDAAGFGDFLARQMGFAERTLTRCLAPEPEKKTVPKERLDAFLDREAQRALSKQERCRRIEADMWNAATVAYDRKPRVLS